MPLDSTGNEYTSTPPLQRRGVNYYPDYRDAQVVRNMLGHEWPGAVIREYELGHAIQYYISGPYYPSYPEPKSRYNPENW